MLRSTRIVGLAFVTLTVLAVSAAPSHAGGLDLRAGAFFPRADSNLFRDDSVLYFVEKDDWIGFSGGAEFSFNLSRTFEVGFGVDGYGRSVDTEYRDFTRPGDLPIFQTLQLHIVPTSVTLKFVPGGSHGVTPYFGVGGDLVYYQYEEFGDFIDFFTDNLEILPESFESDGAALGGHAAVGLRIPIGHDFAITAEGRYQFAQRKRMEEDFDQNIIDVNGASATIGIRLRF